MLLCRELAFFEGDGLRRWVSVDGARGRDGSGGDGLGGTVFTNKADGIPARCLPTCGLGKLGEPALCNGDADAEDSVPLDRGATLLLVLLVMLSADEMLGLLRGTVALMLTFALGRRVLGSGEA